MKVIDIKTGEDITPLPLTLEEQFAEDLAHLASTQNVPLVEIVKTLFIKFNL